MMSITQWIASVDDAILEFSSPEYQLRVWIKAQGPQVSSYTEAFNRLFDDCDFAGFLELRQIRESDAFEWLVALRQKLELLEIPILTESQLAMPRWQEIVELARRAHEALNGLKTTVQ